MTKQVDSPKEAQHPPAGTREPAPAIESAPQTALTGFPGLSAGLPDDPSIGGQAARLADSRFRPAQRQAMAMRISQRHGNRHLQRVLLHAQAASGHQAAESGRRPPRVKVAVRPNTVAGEWEDPVQMGDQDLYVRYDPETQRVEFSGSAAEEYLLENQGLAESVIPVAELDPIVREDVERALGCSLAEEPAGPAATEATAPETAGAAPTGGEAPAQLPTGARASPEEMARIGEARQGIQVETVAETDTEMVNPEVLSQFGVNTTGDERRRIFGPLITVLARQAELPRLIRREEGQLAARQAQLQQVQARGRGGAGLQNLIAGNTRTLARLRAELAGMGGRVSTAREEARTRLTGHFEQQRRGPAQQLAQAQTRVQAGQATVEQLEQRLSGSIVEGLLLQQRIAETRLALGQGEPEELRRELAEARQEREAMVASMTPEEQEGLPSVPEVTDPTRQTLSALRQRFRQVQARLQPLVQARSRLQTATTRRDTLQQSVSGLEQSLARARTAPLTRTVHQTEYRGTVGEGGQEESISLTPVLPGANVDRPEGFMEGGSEAGRMTGEFVRQVLSERYQSVTDPAARTQRIERAVRILSTFGTNEGRADAINTWDRARLTLGPGIAAARGSGVLAMTFFRLLQQDPDAYQRLLGNYGIGVHQQRGGALRFSVVVPEPQPGRARPEGAPAAGTRLSGDAAVDYIIRDPLLLIQLRRAGRDPAMQRAMVETVADYSAEEGIDFVVQVPAAEGRPALSLAWRDLMRGVHEDLVAGSMAAIADNQHGHGNTRRSQRVAQETYLRLAQETGFDPAHPNDGERQMSVAAREQLAGALLETVPARRRSAFRSGIRQDLFDFRPAAAAAQPAAGAAPAAETASPPAGEATPQPGA